MLLLAIVMLTRNGRNGCSDDFIYRKDMALPYPSFEELAEEMSARFAGYKLSDDFREEYYLED
jgi:hypothetical protein